MSCEVLKEIMIKLDGKALALERREALKKQVQVFKEKFSITPCLAVVLVGEDPASQVYVKHKMKACEDAGFKSLEKKVASQTTQDELLRIIQQLNQDSSVHGLLVQLPMPNHIDESVVIESIQPLKDVDGLTTENLGLLFSGHKRVAPCTPQGVIAILKKYNIPLEGQHVVVVGRSQIVGKPMGMLLLEQNATVTYCHSRTQNLSHYLKQADIAVIAAGKPEFLGAGDFSQDVVIVDVGIHRKADGKLCGDVCYGELVNQASAMTPVPGGVGPMTIAMLLENTLKLAQLQMEKGKVQ